MAFGSMTAVTMMVCAFLSLSTVWGCAGEEEMNPSKSGLSRRSHGDGGWFPAGRRELLDQVTGYMKSADAKPGQGDLVGLISPHAGYVYSGKVAGYSFRVLKDVVKAGNAPDTVIVVGFSHRNAFPGVALMDGSSIETPLGKTELDQDANEFLASNSERIRPYYEPHVGEHSAENQLPFVQVASPDSKLVVAIIGDHDGKTLSEFVDSLVKLADRKKIVVVASTDLLHDPNYELVTKTDGETLAAIVSMDTRKLAASWTYKKQVCCGIGPVLAVMEFAKARGCKKGVLLHYRNSGDDFPEGRGNLVVGYGAVSLHVAKP